MKKISVFLILLLAAVLTLSGCDQEQYTEEEEKQVTEKGTEMMQAWLSENVPDAELEKCEAFIDRVIGGRYYLTDYASGTFRQNEETIIFAINTVTGTVYLHQREKELEEAASAYLYETMGITPEHPSFSCHVMAPAKDGGSTTKTFHDSFDFGLPAGIEDIDAFVRDPASRPQIQVMTDFKVPDDIDLFAWDLAAIKKLGEECGMYYQTLDMYNTDQEFSSLWTRETSAYQYGWLEKEGLRLRCVTRYRSETPDRKTNELVLSDRTFVPDTDLIFEKTENGFRYSFPNKEWDHGFYIYADEGSDFLKHDYLFFQDEEGQVGIKGKESEAMTWKKREDGSYVMVEAAHGTVPYFTEGGTFEHKN
ncbi:MAG: hypothetical protein IJT43_01915 [Stomatobaculum sp.]|nr:hypothetical protein [Stomatobaculum sp.]